METAAVTQAQYLTFELRGEEYGVPILGVKEIVEYEPVTRVPTTPVSIRGVINLRGSVVPVLDLGAKFGMGQSEVTKLSCIVFVEVSLGGRAVLMGILVDSVSQVIELRQDEIDAPPTFGTRIRVDCLRGVGRTAAKKLVLLLDMDKVMSSDEILAAVEATTEAEATTMEPAIAASAKPGDIAAEAPLD